MPAHHPLDLCVRALTLTALLLAPEAAFAFCRQKTCDSTNCPIDSLGCIAEGEDLYYDTPCFSFAVDSGSAEPLGIQDDELVQIVAEAFEGWRGVECPEGGNPSFEVESLGAVPAGGIFFCEEESLNVNVWTLDPTWNYEPTSLGYTTSTFVVGTGEVYDADVELNLERIAGIVPATGDVHQALLSVATHEAGHFLGLAHSDDDSAVMAVSYRDLRPRPLTPDDIAGICTLYPPSAAGRTCSAAGYSEEGYDREACEDAVADASESGGGCSLTTMHGGAGSARLWLATLLCLCVAARVGRRPG